MVSGTIRIVCWERFLQLQEEFLEINISGIQNFSEHLLHNEDVRKNTTLESLAKY